MSLRRRAPGGGASPLSSHGSFAGLSLDLNSVLVRRSACERVTLPTFATCAGVGHGWSGRVAAGNTNATHSCSSVPGGRGGGMVSCAQRCRVGRVCLCTRGVRVAPPGCAVTRPPAAGAPTGLHVWLLVRSCRSGSELCQRSSPVASNAGVDVCVRRCVTPVRAVRYRTTFRSR